MSGFIICKPLRFDVSPHSVHCPSLLAVIFHYRAAFDYFKGRELSFKGVIALNATDPTNVAKIEKKLIAQKALLSGYENDEGKELIIQGGISRVYIAPIA